MKEPMREREEEFDLKEVLAKIKIPLYILAVVFGVLGILGTTILMLLSFPIIDNIEIPIVTQADDISGLASRLEAAVASAEGQLETFNRTIADFGASISGIETSFKNTGGAVRDFGSALETVSLGPLLSIGQYGTRIKNAGNDILTTGDSLGQLATGIKNHQTGVAELKERIIGMREGIAKQKNDIVSARDAIRQTFSSMRLVILVFGLLMIILYLGIIALAIAGMG